MAKKKVTGIAEIELRSDRFMPRVREVQQKFQEMTRSGRTALGQLSQHAATTQQNLKTFETSGMQAFRGVGNQATVMGTQLKVSARSMAGSAPTGAGAFKTIGGASQTAAAQVKMSAAEMNNAKLATVGLMGSVAGLAGSFVTLETSMSNIPKRLNAIAKAESLVETQEVSLQRQGTSLKRLTLQLDKARKDGNKTMAEMEIMENKIADTKANIALYTGKLSDAQEDLNLKHMDYADTLKLMATSVFTTFLTAGSTVTIMLSQMATEAKVTTGVLVKMKLAAIANSRFLKLLGVDAATAGRHFTTMSANMHTAGTSAELLKFKLIGVKYAIKGVYAALGPVGWAIIGLTTLYALWTENTLGIRDATRETIKALQEMWEYLKWIMPTIAAVEAAWKALDPEGHAESVGAFNEALNLMGHDLRDVEIAANELGLTLSDLEQIAKDTGTTVQEVADAYGIKYVSSVEKAAGVTKELGLSLEYATKLAEAKGVAVEEIYAMTENLIPAVEDLAAAYADTPDGLVPSVEAAIAAYGGPGGLTPATYEAATATDYLYGSIGRMSTGLNDAGRQVQQMIAEYAAMKKAAEEAGEVHLSIFSSAADFAAARAQRRMTSFAQAMADAQKKNDDGGLTWADISTDRSGRNIYGNPLLRSLATTFNNFGQNSPAVRTLGMIRGQQMLKAARGGGGRRSVGNRVGGTFGGAYRASGRGGRRGPGPKTGLWRYGSRPGYAGGGIGRPSATQRARTLWERYRNAPAVPNWKSYDLGAVGPDGQPLYITPEHDENSAAWHRLLSSRRVGKNQRGSWAEALRGMPHDVRELLSPYEIIGRRGRQWGAGDQSDNRPHLYKTGLAIRKLFDQRFAAETKKVDLLSGLVIEYFGGSRNQIRRGLRDGNADTLNEQARRAREHNANRARFEQRRQLEATLA